MHPTGPGPAAGATPPEGVPPAGVFLVGMMGSGKSTVGRRLAARLGRPFLDADKVLEERCGVPIATVFELEGEAGFRRREAALIDELTLQPGLVLATGGGAVMLPENRERLHARGAVVYLRATLPALWARLRHDRVRPLLRTEDPRARIAELLALREPLYMETAHHVVPTARQPVDRVVAAIIEALRCEPSPSTSGSAATPS